ncbi:DUF6580 family putative transport protein [Parvularcula dongshanensis]|uniref:Rod shape-determining protein MreD n=1 Tax=Parvularcula dongshanensis TaxID=1173995 RepID=A0A840I1J1_9PROT|nr:DUF6580 family putative transport protein [Parvularcula dongshanensis]MBB4658215.1 hypothetical protein [Parvularcula dongshanensis]
MTARAPSRQAALLVLAFAGLAVSWRVLPHMPNVAPVAALSLFAAWATGRAWVGALLSLTVLIVSDAVLGRLLSGFSYDPALQGIVWAMLLAPALLARFLPARAGRAFAFSPLAALGGALAFFLVTNAAVWALGDFYAPGPAGLLTSYAAGLPFFRASLIGDVLFALTLFGGAALAERGGVRLTQRATPA